MSSLELRDVITTGLYWIDSPWPGRLAIAARPRGGDWLEDDISAWRHAGVDVVLSLLTRDEAEELDLTREPDLCRAKGIRFLTFPIPDRHVPGSKTEADNWLARVAELLQAGQNVVIHCRQGIGRSGMIAAALLVSNGTSPGEAFQRISDARGVAVPETTEQKEWVRHFLKPVAASPIALRDSR
ncbi:MAG: tyrosine protein phosphatase [Acidobacteria bacterium]|nr:MAG: tyrosine protein phosphatase [Acidobacteriota bacterium]